MFYMRDKRLLEEVEKVPCSSWAVWSKDFPEKGCLEDEKSAEKAIKDNIGELDPSVILVSLNPAEKIPKGFSNFHSLDSKHSDYNLKKYIQENNLEKIKGAYMTDLVKSRTGSEGKDTEVKKEDCKKFLEEIKLFNKFKDIENFNVICFGRKVFNRFLDYFGGRKEELEKNIYFFKTSQEGLKVNFYGVYFFGSRGFNHQNVLELEDQLKYLNEEKL